MPIPAGPDPIPDPIAPGVGYDSEYQVGDWLPPTLDVYPYDGTTTATLTASAPDGTSTTPAPSVTEVSVDVDGQTVVVQRWATPAVNVTVAGWWVLLWTVTGTGAGVEAQRVFVAPTQVAGGPTWTPTRERVAVYIPERTVEVDRESEGEPILTFTADTRPSGRQVDQQIEDAVAWLLASTGDLDLTLYDTARGIAAVRAAGMAEASWPVRDGDLSAAQVLLTQADAALKALAARNETLTGVDPDDPDGVFEIVPVYSFPAAPCWADELL